MTNIFLIQISSREEESGASFDMFLDGAQRLVVKRVALVPIKSFFPSKKFSLHSFHKLENCWLGKAASVVSTPPKGPPSMITTFFTSIHVRSSLIRVFPTTTAIFFKIPPKVVSFFTIRTTLFTRPCQQTFARHFVLDLYKIL